MGFILGGYNNHIFVSDTRKLFIVKDGNSNVVAWKLTRGVSHDEIEACLNQLNDRIVEPISYVIVDDCCASRLLYEKVFGKNIEVKLDLFHAIQRLTNTLPAKFEYRRKISNALSMSFRQSDDMGAERTMDTDDPQAITRKLDQTIEDLQMSGINCIVFFHSIF